MKKLILICLLFLFTLVGCTYVVDEAEYNQNAIYVRNMTAMVGSIHFKFTPSYSKQKDNYSEYIIITAVATNLGKTPIHVAYPETFLIEEKGLQYEPSWDITYKIIREWEKEANISVEVDGKIMNVGLENAIYGYDLQPYIPIMLMWAFEIPKEGTKIKFYHKIADRPLIYE